MTAALLHETVRTILLDIEGTTTPLDFIYKVLFPYARLHAQQFLKQHGSSSDVRADIGALRQENLAEMRKNLSPPALRTDTETAEVESLAAYLEWLMACDRKSTALKSIQGKIWEEGYRSGQLRSQVFDDVPRALRRWQQQQRDVCIFSSGSVLAQKLLFAHTTAGDLTAYISGYFDTTTGAKVDALSYRKIAYALPRSPSEIIFISDVTTELDAAKSAGLQTRLSVRPGNHPQPASTHLLVRSLDEVFSAQVLP